MFFHALHGDFVGHSIGSSVCLLNRLGGNVLHHSSWWSCHVLRLYRALARRRLNISDNPLCLTSERSSSCKDGIPNLCVRFALPCFRSFQIWHHVTEQNGMDSSWRPLSLVPRSLGFVRLWQYQVVSSSLSLLLLEKIWPTSRWYYDLECSHDASKEQAAEFQ